MARVLRKVSVSRAEAPYLSMAVRRGRVPVGAHVSVAPDQRPSRTGDGSARTSIEIWSLVRLKRLVQDEPFVADGSDL